MTSNTYDDVESVIADAVLLEIKKSVAEKVNTVAESSGTLAESMITKETLSVLVLQKLFIKLKSSIDDDFAKVISELHNMLGGKND